MKSASSDNTNATSVLQPESDQTEPARSEPADSQNDPDAVRRKIFFELFPEFYRDGKLDVDGLYRALQVPAPGKNEAHGKLDSDQIHALRNSAAIIQSGARLLQRRCSLEPETSSIIEALMKAVEKLTGQLKS